MADVNHVTDIANKNSGGVAGQTVAEYLRALSAGSAAPGGGSAAAFAGALAAALCAMAAKLTLKRLTDPSIRQPMSAAAMDADALVNRLMLLADQDACAYVQVMAAYRLPGDSEGDRRSRSSAIQSALQTATAVPMETLQALSDTVHPLQIVLDNGNIHCQDDAGVALRLLRCAAQSTAANIRANLKLLSGHYPASEIQNTFIRISSEITKCLADLNHRYFEDDTP
jgi:formiminotetrahydrofolate cyclodeaminase